MNTTEKRNALIGAAVLGLIVIGLLVWYMMTQQVPSYPSPQTLSPDAPIAFEKAEVTDASEYHTARAAYPAVTPLIQSAGPEADARAVATMKNYAESLVSGFEERAGFANLTAEDIATIGLGGDRKYELNADFETSEGTKTTTYVYMIYEDTLGAHPNAYYRTFTFNRATGDSVSLDDLLEGQYLLRLSELARAKLATQIAEASGGEANMEYIESGTTPTAENFQNFALKGDTLILIFPPYQVGPWALGTQMVEIPLSELSDILAPAYAL